jgi:glycosyltransferase involved in cell wall biosynthesis
MRVLLGPGDTASFPTRLARALADRGARCWVVNFVPHQYSAGASKLGKAKLWGAGLSRLASRLNRGNMLGRILAEAIKGVGQFIVFLWALVRADAIVFVSSRSLLPGYLDLPIYRLLGKRTIRIFLGTDARPRYMTGWHPKVIDETSCDTACRKLARRVRRQRARVRFMSRFASVVVDNPLCGHYQQQPYVNWFHVGFPYDPAFVADGETAIIDKQSDDVTRILHSPSNPKVKGTAQIEQAIQSLEREGMAIEYTRITGMPHQQVLDHLRRCDLVVDQLYSDSPMAGFASEAVAFGKPVVVGGYGWQNLQDRLGDQMPPNLLCKPKDLEQTLREAIKDTANAQSVGQSARQFMLGYWSAGSVANRFAALLTSGDIPDHWWVDPKTIDYWQGLGATDEHRMAVIKALVETCGIKALGLHPEQTVYRTIDSWTEVS